MAPTHNSFNLKACCQLWKLHASTVHRCEKRHERQCLPSMPDCIVQEVFRRCPVSSMNFCLSNDRVLRLRVGGVTLQLEAQQAQLGCPAPSPTKLEHYHSVDCGTIWLRLDIIYRQFAALLALNDRSTTWTRRQTP